MLTADAKEDGLKKPSTFVRSRIKEKMEALWREYGSGMAGVVLEQSLNNTTHSNSPEALEEGVSAAVCSRVKR